MVVDYYHGCGYTVINCSMEKPSFEVNAVVNIEGLHNLINNTRSTLVKLRNRDSVLNFETKKDDVDFTFLKKENSRSEFKSAGLQKCLQRLHKEIILEHM